MKIQYCSDLHLEFPENKEFLEKKPLEPEGEILLLAGDIVPFKVLEKHLDFFRFCADNFEATYWIPGNHEYYFSDLNQRSNKFQEKIFDNVQLLNNTIIKHNDIDLIFSTLWSHIDVRNQWIIENRLNDFRLIRNNTSIFNSYDYNKLHNEGLNFIKSALNEVNNKSIIVSHHAPTLYNYPEKYKGDVLNEAFAVELYDLIKSNGPDVWIYGHTHFNTKDFIIGSTSLKTNQMGYVNYNEHRIFKNNKIV